MVTDDPSRILAIVRMRLRNIHDERKEELVELGARAPRGQLDSRRDGNKKRGRVHKAGYIEQWHSSVSAPNVVWKFRCVANVIYQNLVNLSMQYDI